MLRLVFYYVGTRTDTNTAKYCHLSVVNAFSFKYHSHNRWTALTRYCLNCVFYFCLFVRSHMCGVWLADDVCCIVLYITSRSLLHSGHCHSCPNVMFQLFYAKGKHTHTHLSNEKNKRKQKLYSKRRKCHTFIEISVFALNVCGHCVFFSSSSAASKAVYFIVILFICML